MHGKHWAPLLQTNNENQHNMASTESDFPIQSHIWFLSTVTNEQKSSGDPLSEPALRTIGYLLMNQAVKAAYRGLNVLYLIA